MDVQLVIHLERADRDIVWWAETDDVPGFSAAADTLVDMRAHALAALAEIAAEQGETLGRVTERLVGEAAVRSANPAPAPSETDAYQHQAPTFVSA